MSNSITLDEALKYAKRLEEMVDEVNGMSHNEQRIVLLAREVRRLQRKVKEDK